MLYDALSALTRFYPLQTPRASVLRLLPDVPAGRQFPAKGNLRYAAYPSGGDLVVKNLFWFGEFDPWVGRTLARLARPGDVVCDVGANIGGTSLPLARIVGPSGHVFAFEPLPSNKVCLQENIRASALTNVSVVGDALSDVRGEVAFFVPEGQPGQATVSAKGGIKVATLPFDDWAAENGVDRVAVCKVDVEGHEEFVFRGMTRALTKRQIGAFVFERHGEAGREDPVISLLSERGFRVMQIRKLPVGINYVDVGQVGRGAATADFVAVLQGAKQRSV